MSLEPSTVRVQPGLDRCRSGKPLAVPPRALRRGNVLWRVLFVSFGLLGCDGAIGERAATPEDPTILPSVEVPTVEECAERAETVGATPLRRLTRRQLRNAFADLLGTEALDSAVEERLQELTDGREGGFESSAGAPSAEALRGYVAIGELMATQIVADPSSLVACDLTARSCARELLGVVGRRLFRRPLAVEEIDAYLALRDEFIETDGVEVATTTALSAVMASPHFVYLGEPVDAARRVGETVGIVPHAVASRLSFFPLEQHPRRGSARSCGSR